MPKDTEWDRCPGRRQLPAFAKLIDGEVSEWLMVPLSKSGVRKHRGFESHPLRHLGDPTRHNSSPRGEVA